MQQHGPSVVRCSSCRPGPGPGLTTRLLALQLATGGETRTVTHLQFALWPNYGVPKSEANLVSAVRAAAQTSGLTFGFIVQETSPAPASLASVCLSVEKV